MDKGIKKCGGGIAFLVNTVCRNYEIKICTFILGKVLHFVLQKSPIEFTIGFNNNLLTDKAESLRLQNLCPLLVFRRFSKYLQQCLNHLPPV